MEIREHLRLSPEAVRKVCVDENFFNKGTNEEYEIALNMLKNMNYFQPFDLYTLAVYISNYSDLKDYASKKHFIEYCMFLLSKATVRTYEVFE